MEVSGFVVVAYTYILFIIKEKLIQCKTRQQFLLIHMQLRLKR